MIGSHDKLSEQTGLHTSTPLSGELLVDPGETAPESIALRRNAFWEAALSSSSILAWIAAQMSKPECPFLWY